MRRVSGLQRGNTILYRELKRTHQSSRICMRKMLNNRKIKTTLAGAVAYFKLRTDVQ